MDLRQRLQRIHTKNPEPPVLKRNPTPIFEGGEVENSRGVFFLREKSFSGADEYKGYSLETGNRLGVYLSFLDEDVTGMEAEDLLFLDTETTGLAGGAGTVAFMVGIAYYRKKLFHVKQFLIRDYYEEEALLFSLKEVLASFKVLISFNGKSFDLPLLKDRFTMTRLLFPWEELLHLDVIHLARRLWKLRLGGCSLKELEEGILGFSRPDDVEGALIPSLYFRYLQSGNGEILTPIFQHNVYDLFSMLFLITTMGVYITEPERIKEGQDLYSMGRLYQKKGDREKAAFFYSRSLSQGLSFRDAVKAKKALSLIYKRQKDYLKAVSLWEEMVREEEGFLFPYLELAKYHEHGTRDFARASHYTTLALERVKRQRVFYQRGLEQELVHRHQRILRKMARDKGL